MNLDSRIKSLSDILTCFDIEKVEQFLGKKVYFTNHIGDFHRLKNCKYGELAAEVDDPYYPYMCKPDGDNIDTYSFFVPESSLKPVGEENKMDKSLTLDEVNHTCEKFMKKLDPRIKDRKYIFDCFNANEAKKYIGKKCYVTDWFERFENIEWTGKGTLLGIDDDGHFVAEYDRFMYCLPFDFVVPKEKKFRPYTLNEFLKEFPMNTTITMRKKGDNDCVITCTCTGYRTRIRGTDVCLGVEWISLGTLADEYEYQYMYSEIWKHFGVEENDC